MAWTTNNFFIKITFQAAAAAIYFCFCVNIAAHLEILHDIVEDEKIDVFVDYHMRVKLLAEKLCNIFRLIILMEYVFTSLFLCLLGLQVLKNDNYAKILGAFIHCFAGLLDTFVYSYGGQKLLDKSTIVCNQLYKTDKMYLPIIMMSQKEIKFDGGLFIVSMETYQCLLSRTYSFITFLKAFIK